MPWHAKEASILTTATSDIDRQLETLAVAADRWAGLPIDQRIVLLRRLLDRVESHAAEWVDAAVAGKHIPPGSPLEGEEWVSGPYPTITWLKECIVSLEAVRDGVDPFTHLKTMETVSERAAVRVYPTNIYERLLLHGYSVDVWMEESVMVDGLADTVAVAYKQPTHDGQLALVLGAGNISSIPPLDLLYKLFAEVSVVVVKLNPVNDYLGPVFEKIFAPLIESDFVRFVYGGSEVGEYLTTHDLVDTIHITGSARTHDRIVFGPGEEGQERKGRNAPVLEKPITSELGGVSPTIVVPGPWTHGDIRYQAEHIASQKLHNSGFNCVASQVLILPDGWDRADELVDAVTDAMHEIEDRVAYYPGAEDRQRKASATGHEVRHVGVEDRRTVIRNVDPDHDEHHCFTVEFFAPVLATTSLPASTPAEFLQAAVGFANEKLEGTLGANIIVHPATAKELGDDLERAIEDLQYGSVAVNTWTGVAYLVTRAAWGAAPGHTLDDVQSGIGMVHNSMLFDKAQKAVVRAPFRPFPRGVRHGSFWLSPRPPWFVTNKTAATTTKRLTYYAADGKVTRLAGIFASALRG